MLRALTILGLGWLLLASVAGLGASTGLTVMLPSTSAVLLTRTAVLREHDWKLGLAVAVSLGYLEDLHQGTPIGCLSLAHALAFLLTLWAGTRIALRGMIARAIASGLVILTIDLLTFAILMALADPLGISTRALIAALPSLRWHALATILVAPAVWLLADTTTRIWDRRNRLSRKPSLLS